MDDRRAQMEAAPEPRQVREAALPPDGRQEALARILALDAEAQPDVRSFRQGVLRNRLLKPERVADWIEARVREEGSPTVYARVALTPDGRLTASGRVWPPRKGVAGYDRVAGCETASLDYPDATLRVLSSRPIPMRGIPGRLKMLAKNLAHRYHPWSEAQAVAFVLSGRIPTLVRARAEVTPHWPFPARSLITLTLSPRLTPREVAELYREARSGTLFGDAIRAAAALPEARVKPMSEEHCRLAVFIAEVNDGRAWSDALSEWSRRHPEHARKSLEGFIRAAREAYERVTGQALNWQRGRGEHKQPKRSRRPARRKGRA